MKKAVILARVSTAEQEEGYSLDGQMERLQEYCDKHKFKVIKTYRLIESSTRGERRKFREMLDCASSQGETIAVVVDKVDRLQRRVAEQALLEPLILEGKIELHFRNENNIIHKKSRSWDKTMWNLQTVLAQNYTDIISDNVCKAIDQKLKKGEWIGPAPVGYLNQDDPVTGRKDVIVDKSRAYLVKRIFEEYATGNHSMPAIAKMAKEWGLRNKTKSGKPLCRGQIHKMLHNPFYYGQMRVSGELYPHRYEPIISIGLYEKCQAVIKGHNKQPLRYRGKEFIFRGMIRCAHCGCLFCSEEKKGQYIYLRPTKSKGPW